MSKIYLIGEREAEFEVVVDTLIRQQGGKDQALLYVVKEIYTTAKVYILLMSIYCCPRLFCCYVLVYVRVGKLPCNIIIRIYIT